MPRGGTGGVRTVLGGALAARRPDFARPDGTAPRDGQKIKNGRLHIFLLLKDFF